jgi:uncharacterized phage protein gp47/JayE
MSSGLTPEGFKAKRLPEVKTEIEARLVEAFGDPDLREESVYGQFVGIQSELSALLWSLAETVYASQYPDTATGVSLDNVAALTGIVRIPATPTQVNAVAIGQPNTFLPALRVVENRRTGDAYRSTINVHLTPTAAVLAGVSVSVVEDEEYAVTINDVDYTFVADGDTAQQILTGLSAALSGSGFDRDLQMNRLDISRDTPFAIELSSNLAFEEIGSIMPMRASVAGAKLLPAGDLTEIQTAVSGWDRVSNPQPGITGTNRETDSQLRARRERSTRILGRQTLPAIQSRLEALPLVQDVAFVANSGEVTDAFGTPRQHVWAIVEGGNDDEIADVLFNTVAAGIGYRGEELVIVESDVTGKQYEVKFDRPTYIDPTIEIEYVRLSNFPSDGEQRIIDALTGVTFRIFEKLVASRLYTPVNTVQGVQIDLLEVNGGVPRIEPDPNERIRILSGNITLTDVTP